MKLKNKRTGEIKDWDFGNWYQTILNPENKEKYECNLNDFIDRTVKFREEWEDMPEEPKWLEGYWFIDSCGGTVKQEDDVLGSIRREIGNYFRTKEEAEKAVEKLKAWKRLKDKGFRFYDWKDEPTYRVTFEWEENIKVQEIQDDLDLLFGGEE